MLTLNLAIDLIGELADVLAKHRLFGELAGVVLLDPLQLDRIGGHGLVDDRLHVVFELLHDVLVLKLGDIVHFSLHIGVEKRALLR